MKTGYFEEKEGVKSSTRLFSFILLLALIGFDFALIFTTHFTVDYNFIMFNFLILIGVFAPKYLHKLAESKFNVTK
jgi:hypothetical protein